MVEFLTVGMMGVGVIALGVMLGNFGTWVVKATLEALEGLVKRW